jgi:hypothetical protein
VTQALIEGGVFAGTASGGCIASKLRAASVAPFAGAAVSVRKTVQVPGE